MHALIPTQADEALKNSACSKETPLIFIQHSQVQGGPHAAVKCTRPPLQPGGCGLHHVRLGLLFGATKKRKACIPVRGLIPAGKLGMMNETLRWAGMDGHLQVHEIPSAYHFTFMPPTPCLSFKSVKCLSSLSPLGKWEQPGMQHVC